METLKEDLKEIELLSQTLGIDIVDTTIHNLKTIHPSTFISKKKAKKKNIYLILFFILNKYQL